MGRIKVTGANVSQTRLRNMARRADDLTPIWPKVGDAVARNMAKQFATQGKWLATGTNIHKNWVPLDPAYAKRKAAEGFGRKILVRTGDLKKEFVGRPMSVERYTQHSAEFGSASLKSRWMAGGTKRRQPIRKKDGTVSSNPTNLKVGQRIGLPRPILYKSERITNDVNRIIKKYILGSEFMRVGDEDI